MNSKETIMQTLLPSLILFALLPFTAIRLYGQAATTITVQDTRNWDSLPSFYKKTVRFDFKNRTVINSPGSGTYAGLMSFAPWGDASGGPVYQLSFATTGIYLRSGTYPSTWSSWNRLLTENYSGVTTLGNGSAGSGLNVNGTIKTREVNVTTTGWPDYVFQPDYKSTSLDSLSERIKQLGHLPDMPSAKEVETEGQNLGEMNKKLLQKIEELTLYVVEQQKEIKHQGKLLEQQAAELDSIKQKISK